MDNDLKTSIERLLQELKNDLPFFGICGFAVALIFVWEGRFQEFGILEKSQWAHALFNDFLPANAFVFTFY